MSDAILGQLMLFEFTGICILSLAHESAMRGYLVYVLIVKYLSHRFCYIRLDGLIVEFFWDFLKHFLRGLWTVSFIGIIE